MFFLLLGTEQDGELSLPDLHYHCIQQYSINAKFYLFNYFHTIRQPYSYTLIHLIFAHIYFSRI